jgi:serine/threonine-protein kinase
LGNLNAPQVKPPMSLDPAPAVPPDLHPQFDALPGADRLRVTLTVTEGPHQGARFTFAEHDTFLVGRSPEAHFALPDDPYFSRLHFLVEVNPPLCRLVDMNSRNGTLLNGQRVPAADLKDGDVIRGGRTALKVALELPAPGQDAPTVDGPAAVPTTPGRAEPVPTRLPDAPGVVTLDPSAWPRVPGYRLLRELGRGGMGVVYLASREKDGLHVALKTVLPAVKPTPTTVGRFLREADILRQLAHPHIVSFRDMGEVGGVLYFAMDFVEGRDAGKVLRTQGPLPVGRAVDWACQLLEALAHAHARGFVHRDVKPSNLLVTDAGGREEIKVADFGLARAYHASPLSGLTVTGAAGGTPAYMPPEQIRDFRSVKPAADQYAAAATLYNLLTGQLLYDNAGTAMDLYLRILQDSPVPLRSRRPEVQRRLAAVVHKALARRPEERFAHVSLFRQAVLPFAR